MKLATLAVSVLFISACSLPGCSRDETPENTAQKVVVKRPITLPAKEETPEQTPSKQASATVPETKGADKIVKTDKEEGVYIAEAGDTLSKIAAKKDVYGDPLKWILLYRINREALVKITKDASFPQKDIPAGTKLKIGPPADAGKGSKINTKTPWVINILSSTKEEKIVPDAISLIDNDYPAYITSAKVKGHDYMRLRVGFFNDKTSAEDESKKIMTLLNISDLWTTRSEESEFKEFGGY